MIFEQDLMERLKQEKIDEEEPEVLKDEVRK